MEEFPPNANLQLSRTSCGTNYEKVCGLTQNDGSPGFSSEETALPEDLPVETAILIISEAEKKDERLTLKKYASFPNVCRTFYKFSSADDYVDPIVADEFNGVTWEWDWIAEAKPELCDERKFDLIVARSMICACIDDDFDPNRSHFKLNEDKTALARDQDGRLTVINTCGQITRGKRFTVLQCVAALLSDKPEAVAHLTCSPVKITGVREGPSPLNRKYTYTYWKDELAKLSSDFLAEMVFVDNKSDQPVKVFSIVITRKSEKKEEDKK